MPSIVCRTFMMVGAVFACAAAPGIAADAAPGTAAASGAEELFELRIRPVLMQTCFKCHGGEKTKANLRVDTLGNLLAGGDSGPALKPGDIEQSLLIQAIRYQHEDIQMPPKEPLAPDVVKAFEQWVAAGAVWPAKLTIDPEKTKRHWAFLPVDRNVTPPAGIPAWSAHPIDRFIGQQLSAHNLTPNPAADRRTLIRRAYLDLIGLPPEPADIDAFINDQSADAWSKVIERLLTSPQYGERWGRHWLDLARYADTSGDAADAPIIEARLYRDYVIAAFNRDMPYDQFLVEQIAGDLLAKAEPADPARDRELIIATGYIALTRRFNNAEYSDMHLVIDSTLDTIGRGVLGMTLSCARCHDHKFDPITMRDYYGLYGYFSSTQYPHASTEHGRERKNFVELPPGSGGGLAYAVFDKTDPQEIADAPILKAGNPREQGDIAPRAFLSTIDPTAPQIPEGRSGRLQLARWIASAENPLTARVMANRIWQYHFGKGIVPTSSTFGLQGDEPTHPALLDYLAARFIDSGWSIKELHRLIMHSRTYQMASDADHRANLAADPANTAYWHYPARRLEAEAIRDAVLAVSGRLDPSNPGDHPFPKPVNGVRYDYTQHRPFTQDYDHVHRTVYLPSRRLGKHPFMELFNGPDTNEPAARREVSTVPMQALFWMNSLFVRESSQSFAKRIMDSADDAEQRVARAYELAYGREPTPDEMTEALSYLAAYENRITQSEPEEARQQQAWASLCRILLASNEFIYMD